MKARAWGRLSLRLTLSGALSVVLLGLGALGSPAQAQNILFTIDATNPSSTVITATSGLSEASYSQQGSSIFLPSLRFTTRNFSFLTGNFGAAQQQRFNLLGDPSGGVVFSAGNVNQAYIAGQVAFSGSSTANLSSLGVPTSNLIGDIVVRDDFGQVTGIVLGQFQYIAPSRWNVRTVDDNGSPVNSIDDGEALLASRPTAGTATPSSINYNGNFPGVSGDDFALEAVGRVDVLSGTSGTFTLYVNSDDGFRLWRNGTVIDEFTTPTGSSNVTMSNITLNDGDVLRLTYFERGGGEHLTFRVNDSSGALVGDSASGISIAPVQDFVVTNTADGGTNGTCDAFGTGDGCTLREAINAANNSAGPDYITFRSGVTGTITLGGTELTLSSDITITGPGANLLSVSGNNASRVFRVDAGSNVVLSGLTVMNGNVNRDSGGGGIRNYGVLNVANCIISGNTVNGSTGGGIGNNNSGNLTVTNSTISGNYGSNGGGGIYSDFAVLTVTNSTISGNSVGNSLGGGILSYGVTTVTNSTISGNYSGSPGFGGGIARGNGSISLLNTIVAGNNAMSGVDFFGTLNSLGHNLIGNTSNTTITGDTTGNILNQSAQLAPLGNYGGTTPTHALLSNSPAINNGTATGAPTTDQRGYLRPINGRIDIGAFELDSTQSGPNFVVNNTGDTDDGTCSTGHCTLREAINAANARAGDDTITFSSLFDTTQTIQLGSSLPDISDNVTVTGPGANKLTVRGPGTQSVRLLTVAGDRSLTMSGLTFSNGIDGITCNGTLTASDCIFSDNGHGIARRASGGPVTVTVTRTTFSGNGSGITSTFGSVTATNCTFTGGEVGINTFISTDTVTNCTLSGLDYGIGNGSGTVNLKNSLVLGNISSISISDGTFNDGGNNITSGTAAQAGLDPNGLQDNGGPTKTIALIAGSPAINAGNNSGAPATDQRGVARPQVNRVDIGAFELQFTPSESLVVTTTSDEDNGTSDPAFGSGTSLREAIAYANSKAGDDTITFSSLFNSAQTITLGGTELSISSNLTINGPGQSKLTVSGNDASRVFNIGSGTVEIKDLTVSGGRAADGAAGTPPIGPGGAASDGGGILNAGTLTLTNVTLSGNRAGNGGAGAGGQPDGLGGYGGGIASSNTLTLSGCTLSDNTSGNGRLSAGGGISLNNANATLTIINSTIHNNATGNNGDGGGIFCNGALVLTNSTLSDNTASAKGGGLFTLTSSATITGSTFARNTANSGGGIFCTALSGASTVKMTNCTLSGNNGGTRGGAIDNRSRVGASMALTMRHCTLSGNSATSGAGIASFANVFPVTVNLGHSILSNSGGNFDNLSSNGGTATITSAGYNLSNDGSGGFLSGTGDILNANPNLGALANNGGPTATHALLASSPAINAGNNALAKDADGNDLTTDQRGAGFARIKDGTVDIGAFEVQNSAPAAPTDSDTGANQVQEGAANGTTVGITAAATDDDGDTLNYSLTNNAGGRFSINATSGVVSVADATLLNFESATSHQITVQASDGNGAVSTQNFTINVLNAAPSTPVDANADANQVQQGAVTGTTVGVTASSTDPNGPTVSYSITNDPSNGGFRINASSGVVTVNDAAKINAAASGGSYVLTIAASDGTASRSANFTVAVSAPANTAPTASDGTASVFEDDSVVITLSANDGEGDALTFTITQLPLHGTLTNENGSALVNNKPSSNKVKYTPAANYDDTDSFKFKANDGALDSNEATVSITVDLMSDAPVAVGNAYSVMQNGTLNVAAPGVLGNDTDPDGDALTAIRVSNPGKGTLLLRSNGSFIYTPNVGYSGPDSFTYKASDGFLESNVVTVSITVLSPLSAFTFSPVAGAPGTAVTVTGSGLATVNSVKIGGIAATGVTPVNDNRLTFVVPAGALIGPVELTTPLVSGSTGLFTVAPRNLTLNRSNGRVGEVLKVSGINLGGASLKVTIGGAIAPIVTLSPDYSFVQVRIPANAVTGDVVVSNAGGSVNLGTYSVLPTIANISPNKGAPGTLVTIGGSILNGASDVRFGGVSVGAGNFTVVSSTKITAIVPALALSGPVSVVTPQDTATSPVAFLAAPRVTNVSPANAAIGANVTITGANLSTASVSINGRTQQIVSRSATQLVFKVVTRTTSGNLVVSNAAGSANAGNFTVTP
jgi:CSLREA domain-containing protein